MNENDVHSVGPDDPYDIGNVCLEDYQWFVYWYEDMGYDGRGQAVALRKDGLVDVLNLGHCSCYGAIDGMDVQATVDMNELLRDKDDIHDLDVRQEIKSKVREIIINQPNSRPNTS